MRVLALQTSAMLGALLVAEPAFAACTPDPTVANATTNCTGTDSDGLTVDASNSRVVVAQGAIVRPGNAVAAILSRSSNAGFEIRGLVDGGSNKAGLFVTTGPATTVPCDPYAGASPVYCFPGSSVTVYPSANAGISVLAGGTITGAQGILIRRSSGNGSISVDLDNAGTITGTAGPAIIADQTGLGALRATNRASGTIGGIMGSLTYIDNAGTIDGGSNSAIASTYQLTSVINSGRIVSSGQAATLDGTGNLFVSNAVGATIDGSATAIRTTGALSLSNQGIINGSVISTASNGQASTIDTRSGTINGDLLLGAGDDMVRALYDATTGRIRSITGTVDGGGGIDTIAFGVDADTTFRHVVLPTNFERLGFDLSKDAVATLAPDFNADTAIHISGGGTLVNQAALVTSGPAITSAFSVGGLSFDNRGSIVSTTNSSIVYAARAPIVTNSGTITTYGGSGVSVDYRLTNSGTILASDTGALIGSGTLTNSGTIRSSGGTGVSLYGTTMSTNSGSIAGATTGLAMAGALFTNSGTITGRTGLALTSGRLTNDGTIIGSMAGASVGNGTLLNSASGRIVNGITSSGGRAIVANAGQITGTVDLTPPPGYYDGSNDIFIDDGGSVTGAILLGGGDDQLIVDLDTGASRPLAGAAGGVDAGAGRDTIRYRVRAHASAALVLPNGFEALAYELDTSKNPWRLRA
ncbi:hypothetical protein P7B04_24300 [Sphingobium yanoikuyae]|uniref:beta strand repeat-containing protein n=1 Tax=Sphingobium yanoikuyae TaxID=13690 RepID=UPI00240F2212|nr:hypothetical protein [Sphingobium yanoikuyae]MDG2515790.1 hypothetical protein [Sphingobium yanoikuyae]